MVTENILEIAVPTQHIKLHRNAPKGLIGKVSIKEKSSRGSFFYQLEVLMGEY